MYICVCNAIREKELRRIARLVPGDAEAAYAALGKRPDCGTCMEDAQDIISEERRMCPEKANAA